MRWKIAKYTNDFRVLFWKNIFFFICFREKKDQCIFLSEDEILVYFCFWFFFHLKKCIKHFSLQVIINYTSNTQDESEMLAKKNENCVGWFDYKNNHLINPIGFIINWTPLTFLFVYLFVFKKYVIFSFWESLLRKTLIGHGYMENLSTKK